MVLHLIDGSVDKAPQYLSTVVRVQQDVVPSPAVAQLQTILLMRIQAKSSRHTACRAALQPDGGFGGGGGGGREDMAPCQSEQCWDCVHTLHGNQSDQPCCSGCRSNLISRSSNRTACNHSCVHSLTRLLVIQGEALSWHQQASTFAYRLGCPEPSLYHLKPMCEPCYR